RPVLQVGVLRGEPGHPVDPGDLGHFDAGVVVIAPAADVALPHEAVPAAGGGRPTRRGRPRRRRPGRGGRCSRRRGGRGRSARREGRAPVWNGRGGRAPLCAPRETPFTSWNYSVTRSRLPGGRPGSEKSGGGCEDGTMSDHAAPQQSAQWAEPHGDPAVARISRRPADPVESARASRLWWDRTADEYQAEHGGFLQDSGFVWGPEGLTEDDAALLGPRSALRGARVLEIGCGAAQCARWLAAQGARVVGVDIALGQLRHSRRIDGRTGARTPVAQADAQRLPFAD